MSQPSPSHFPIVVLYFLVYLANGTELVWIVDPHFQTVRIYCRGAQPEMFNIQQELSGEPLLPELRVPVAEIFE